MTVTGSKTGKKYTMTPGDTGRTFVGPDGESLTEAQMKELEGDWTESVGNVKRYTGANGQSITKEQQRHYGGQDMNDAAFKQATPAPNLGDLARRLAAPKPSPAPIGTPSVNTQPQLQKVGDMNGAAGGQFDIESIRRLLGAQPQQPTQQPAYQAQAMSGIPENLAQAILMWHLGQGQGQDQGGQGQYGQGGLA